MKTINLLLATLFTLHSSLITHNSLAQNWQWASHVGSTLYDGGTSIIADKFGNLYATGGYKTACFFQTDTLACNGYSDFFLVKYDNVGNEVWVKKFGGYNFSSDQEGIGGIAYDSINDFIYITGSFSDTPDLCGITLTAGSQGFFLAKFDLNGNCIWAKESVGSGKSMGLGVALDNMGSVFVCGTNTANITLGNFPVPRGGFIAKYDAQGNCMWAKNKFRFLVSYAPSELEPYGIKIYNSTILVAGNAYNDTIVVDTITALNHGSHSAFISSFDLNGNVKWLKLDGGPYGYLGNDFSIDNAGNSYVGGYFDGAGYFDTILLANPMYYDAFLAKYNIQGQLQWVKQLHSIGDAQVINVSSTANGNTYLTGYFRGSANFGNFNIMASTAQDMFAARYDSNGVCLGVKNFGTGLGMAIYAKDNSSFWVEGTFTGSVSIGGNNFTSYGASDIFVAKSAAITGIEKPGMRAPTGTLQIYANPTKGICNVTVPEELLTEKNLMLTIYSNEGKLIQQIPVEINQEKIIINLEEEAAGIYNITLGNSEKMYSGKIVFE